MPKESLLIKQNKNLIHIQNKHKIYIISKNTKKRLRKQSFALSKFSQEMNLFLVLKCFL